MSHTKNRIRPQVKANGLKDHQVAGLATFVTDRIRKQVLIRIPEHLRQTVVVAIQDFLSNNELLIDRRKAIEMTQEKTLGEILYDAFVARLNGCDEWSKTSAKFKAEYEEAAEAVRYEALCRAQIDQVLFEDKFHGAMELAKTHMQHAASYAKERDAYMKSYKDASDRRNEPLTENAKLKEKLKATQSPREIVEEEPVAKSQRHSLYVLIVRQEDGIDFSVRSFMQPTVTHSQMSAIVNILSEQLADGMDNLAQFRNRDKEAK